LDIVTFEIGADRCQKGTSSSASE